MAPRWMNRIRFNQIGSARIGSNFNLKCNDTAVSLVSIRDFSLFPLPFLSFLFSLPFAFSIPSLPRARASVEREPRYGGRRRLRDRPDRRFARAVQVATFLTEGSFECVAGLRDVRRGVQVQGSFTDFYGSLGTADPQKPACMARAAE